jgi:hypothetical protein
MAYFSDYLLDLALANLDTAGDKLYICSDTLSVSNATPPSFAEVTSTYALGNKTGISIGAPENGASNGRKVTVASLATGDVTATGTATKWAIVDSANSRVLVAGTLSASQVISSVDNTFSLAAFDITLPDPA